MYIITKKVGKANVFSTEFTDDFLAYIYKIMGAGYSGKSITPNLSHKLRHTHTSVYAGGTDHH